MKMEIWGFPNVTKKPTFWDIFPLKLSLTQSSVSKENPLKLCLPRPEQCMSRGKVPLCHWWAAFTWSSSHLNYHINSKLFPRRMTQSSASLGPEQWLCRDEASPVSQMNNLFKSIIPLNLSYWLKALPLRRPNNECEEFLPQCHQQMAISRPSSKYNSTNSKR